MTPADAELAQIQILKLWLLRRCPRLGRRRTDLQPPPPPVVTGRQRQGFASLSAEQRRILASRGGKARAARHAFAQQFQ